MAESPPNGDFFDVRSLTLSSPLPTPSQHSDSIQILINENFHFHSSNFAANTSTSRSIPSINPNDVNFYRDMFKSINRSPKRPSLFFSTTIFHKVYYHLYPIILPLLSLAYLIVDMKEEGPVLNFTAITTVVFVAIHFFMFSLETIYFLVTNTLLERLFELSEWVLDLVVLICHIVSVGFAIESSLLRRKVESSSKDIVRIGIVVSIITILLRILFFFHRLFKFSKITKNVDHLWMMGLGKSVENSIIRYKHLTEKLRKNAKGAESIQQLDAMNTAIRGRLMESFLDI